jgi:tripartite ATP-independent transporter DctM subunit
MSVELITILLFGGLLFFLMMGVPIFIAMGGVAVVFAYIFKGPALLYIVATSTFSQGTTVTLMTIPMFLLMGNFLVHSGISEKMYNALSYWLSEVPGGLAVVSLIVCVALAMCGGFGPGIVTMGMIAVPSMLKHNYDKSIAVGSVMAGGALGEIIPPAIIMIIFSFVTGMSIGKVFAGGIIPGFLLAFLYLIYIIGTGILKPNLMPKSSEKVTWKMRWGGLKDLILPVSLIVLVLGSIFTGAATPTEAAGVGALGSMLICLIHGKLTWKVVQDTCLGTLSILGMVMWIVIPAALFTIFYTSIGAQAMIKGFVVSLEVSRYVILIAMIIIIMICGMFLDDAAIVILCAPIFMPIVKVLGFDPHWFAILFILCIQCAFLTPPFGYGLIMMKGVAPPEVSTRDLWRSVPPFIIMQVIVIALVIIFPQLVLWLVYKI